MEAVAASSDAGAGTEKPSILLVAPPARGGLATHVIFLLAALQREGYRVAVASDRGGRIAEAAGERGVTTYEVTCTARSGASRTALRAVRLAQVIREFRPHIIHAHSFSASTVAAVAYAIAGLGSLVLTIHNYPPGTSTMIPEMPAHRWAFRFAVHRARRLIAVSDALRRDLVVAHPGCIERCVTIYNGVEIERSAKRDPEHLRWDLGVSAEATLVGMVARLAPQKGIREFIRAAYSVVESSPSVQFVVVGDGPLMEDAQALRGELGLDDHLRLVGEVGWARDLISSFDILVVASLSEGSSVAAMEAMVAGKPVVATNVGGVPEVVADGETGVIVEPGDPAALASAILRLAGDPQKAAEMGDKGRQRAAAKFSIDDMIERTKGVYADCLREQIEAEGSGE